MNSEFYTKGVVASSLTRSSAESEPHASDSGRQVAALVRCSSVIARSKIPEDVAKRFEVLPLTFIEGAQGCIVTVASSKALTFDQKRGLEFCCGCSIKEFNAAADIIAEAIFKAYRSDGTQLHSALATLHASRKEKKDAGAELALAVVEFSSGGEIGETVRALLEHALAIGATDLHLLPRIDGAWVKARVQGALCEHTAPLCDLTVLKEIVRRVKVLANLNTSETRRPQEGAFLLGERLVRVRVSTMPTVHGEKIVFRFLRAGKTLTREMLGYSDEVGAFIEQALKVESGAILLSGPTGSGKSTTLYALARELAHSGKNVVTIEDPVEMLVPELSQTQLDRSVGLDYPAAVRAALRHDPDVLLIGEIRDTETACAALSAALTGHLVLSTVHAKDSFEVFLRLKELGVDLAVISAAVRLVISQRLIPTLCERCRVIDLGASNGTGQEIYKGVGCTACDYSTYEGSIVAAEALLTDTCFLEEVRTKGVLRELFLNHTKRITLEDSLSKLLITGRISKEAFDRYASLAL